MLKPTPYTLYPLGDSALTLQFGDRIDAQIMQRIHRIYQTLLANRMAYWWDIIPAYTSITIVYNKADNYHHIIPYTRVKEEVEGIMARNETSADKPHRTVRIPVCYDPCFSLDGERLASDKNITLAELVNIHTSRTYQIYMIGFLPGFAYMGSVDAAIAAPRLAQPRSEVPPGSVGIAGDQTGIYPFATPGGWNIIGRTPLKLFDIQRPNPVLLDPGDSVTFIPISKDDFEAFDSSRFPVFGHESPDR